jgi:hypothetical protein
MAFFVFGIMFEGGVDLRNQSLSQRQKDLARACGKGREPIPHLFLVEAFPEGEPLLEWCARYQLEASCRNGEPQATPVAQAVIG